jgi:hypothetical protein
MSPVLTKVCLWLALAIGLVIPVLISVQTLAAVRQFSRLPTKRYYSYLTESTAGIGPLRITITPRIWPAALVLVGAVLMVIGLAAILKSPTRG